MGGNFQVTQDRLDELGEQVPQLHELRGAKIVFASGVQVLNPKEPRHLANLIAAGSSSFARVPHLYMVDSESHRDVAPGLKASGAIVVPIDNETEGGLFRPYALAAMLVDHYAPNALFVKFEGDKNKMASDVNVLALLNAARHLDVITGVRSKAAWDGLEHYMQVTESMLALVIREIAGVPFDTPSGVLALNAAGRQAFYKFPGDNWGYLIDTPARAKRMDLRVGETVVDFRYDPDAIAAERNNPDVQKKRRNQMQAMLDAAVSAAGGLDTLNTRQRQAYDAGMRLRAGLEGLAAAA